MDVEPVPAAVQRLSEMIPAPAPRRLRDWIAVERQLGTPLPEDYKELVETYGGGVFDETVWLLDPECPDGDYNLLHQARERAEILAELWEFEAKRAELLNDVGAQVLPWAYVEGSGAYLYWLRRSGQEPSEWTVLYNEGRGPEWEHHASPCAPFLLALLTGQAETEYFSGLPLARHRFESNGDILGGHRRL